MYPPSIQNNHTEKVNKAEYLIQLNTEVIQGPPPHTLTPYPPHTLTLYPHTLTLYPPQSSDNTKAVQFACTQEQLQVSKS